MNDCPSESSFGTTRNHYRPSVIKTTRVDEGSFRIEMIDPVKVTIHKAVLNVPSLAIPIKILEEALDDLKLIIFHTYGKEAPRLAENLYKKLKAEIDGKR